MTSAVRTQPQLRAPRPAPSRPGSGRPEARHTPNLARSRRPDLRVIDEAKERRRRRTVPVLCLAGVVVFASLLASAVFHSMLVTGQDNLDRLDKSITTEKAALDRAKLALAHAQSPERIARAAQDRGMVPADHQTWVSPDSDAPPVVTGTGGDVTPTDEADDTGTDDTGTDDTVTTGTGPVTGANEDAQ